MNPAAKFKAIAWAGLDLDGSTAPEKFTVNTYDHTPKWWCLPRMICDTAYTSCVGFF